MIKWQPFSFFVYLKRRSRKLYDRPHPMQQRALTAVVRTDERMQGRQRRVNIAQTAVILSVERVDHLRSPILRETPRRIQIPRCIVRPRQIRQSAIFADATCKISPHP